MGLSTLKVGSVTATASAFAALTSSSDLKKDPVHRAVSLSATAVMQAGKQLSGISATFVARRAMPRCCSSKGLATTGGAPSLVEPDVGGMGHEAQHTLSAPTNKSQSWRLHAAGSTLVADTIESDPAARLGDAEDVRATTETRSKEQAAATLRAEGRHEPTGS